MVLFIGFCVFYYLLGGMAIGLGLHRTLSHRAVMLPKWLERGLVTLSLPAGTPIQWVGNHRYHHAHTEKPEDPHSPHISGFWFAHVGWYLNTSNRLLCIMYSLAGPLRMLFDGVWRPRTNLHYTHLAEDVARDPYYRLISRPFPYSCLLWLHVAIVFGLAWWLAGWSGFIWMWLQLAFMYNVCDAIDSFAHLYGSKPYHRPDEARNNRLLGWLTLGEGWHANHHTFPQSARHGLLPGQRDWTWGSIRLLERLGLASAIYLPTEEEIRLAQKGTG